MWFINKLAKLDTKWGTPSPIQVEDPKYGIILPMRAYGQYGFRVGDARLFLSSLLGAFPSFTDEQIKQYFRGKVMATIGSQIGTLFNENISFVNISAHLEGLSEAARLRIILAMEKYGIVLETFYFESLNVPAEDPSFIKLKAIKEKSAELNGIMMEAQLGSQMGQMMPHLSPTGVGAPPPLPSTSAPQFHVAVNGQQLGAFSVTVLQQMITAGTINAASLVWRQGMAAWQAASTVQELSVLFAPPRHTPPPIPPSMPPAT